MTVSRARGAFTLVELLAALTVTGLVVASAYGALGAGLDARSALERERREVEAEALVRSMLADALRHATVGSAGIDAADFESTGSALRFRSRGVLAPFGTGMAWRVTLDAGAAGVRLRAEPPPASGDAPITITLPDVRAVRVAVRPLAAEPRWVERFASRGAPAAVLVRFLGARGDALPPLVVRTGAQVAR